MYVLIENNYLSTFILLSILVRQYQIQTQEKRGNNCNLVSPSDNCYHSYIGVINVCFLETYIQKLCLKLTSTVNAFYANWSQWKHISSGYAQDTHTLSRERHWTPSGYWAQVADLQIWCNSHAPSGKTTGSRIVPKFTQRRQIPVDAGVYKTSLHDLAYTRESVTLNGRQPVDMCRRISRAIIHTMHSNKSLS